MQRQRKLLQVAIAEMTNTFEQACGVVVNSIYLHKQETTQVDSMYRKFINEISLEVKL